MRRRGAQKSLLPDEHEAVAVLILEKGLHHAPGLHAWRLGEFDSPAAQLLVRRPHVVGPEDDAGERADALFRPTAIAFCEDDYRICPCRCDFEPAQAIAPRLVVALLNA